LAEQGVFEKRSLAQVPETRNATGMFSRAQLEGLETIYLAGGEPLIMPEVLDLMGALPETCRLSVNTNLSRLPGKFLKLIPRFKKFTLICSCDGVDEGFEMMRYPIKFQKFQENLFYVLREFPKVDVVLTSTFSALNIGEVENIFDFIESTSKEHRFLRADLHILSAPSHLGMGVLTAVARRGHRENLMRLKETRRGFLEERGLEIFLDTLIITLERATASPEIRQKARAYVDWMRRRRPIAETYFRKTGIGKALEAELFSIG
jgi:hypothetical protein